MTSTQPSPIRLGTRGSELALWQARHVAVLLQSFGYATEEVIIQTTGDLDQHTAFSALGAKGIFVKQIEAALLDGSIDLAVHSLKDLPTELPRELELGCVLKREAPWDALVSVGGKKLSELPESATVATGSLRRGSQLLALRPDLKLSPLRGNVPTRIRKIREGGAAATLLAVAGLRRLGLEHEIAQVFTVSEMTPSMGQGSLGLEVRCGELGDVLGRIEDAEARTAAEAERAFIHRLGGGCKTPAGVLAEPDGEGTWRITAFLGTEDGGRILRETRAGLNRAGLNQRAEEMAAGFRSRADEKILAALEGPGGKSTRDPAS